jgi:futalosine hydrolase
MRDFSLTVEVLLILKFHLFRNAELCFMKVVITAATAMEIEPFRVLRNSLDGIDLDYLISGVGAIASTYALEKYISSSSPNLLIQIGIAGTYGDKLEVGSAFAVIDELNADMGVFEKDGYKDIFDMGLVGKNDFPFQNATLKNPNESILSKSGLPMVVGMGVNEISTSPAKIKLFKEKYGADIESMEGNAFHYVCLMNKIPFIQLRGISNKVGERNKNLWEINKSLTAVFDATHNLLKSVEKENKQ